MFGDGAKDRPDVLSAGNNLDDHPLEATQADIEDVVDPLEGLGAGMRHKSEVGLGDEAVCACKLQETDGKHGMYFNVEGPIV